MKTSLEKCLGHPIILPMGTSKPQFPFININKTSITVIPWFHTWRIIPPECLIFQWIILRFLWKTTMVSNQIPSRMILPVPCDPCDPCAGRHQHEASLVVSSSPGKNMVNWELRITTTNTNTNTTTTTIIIITKNRMDITLSVQTTRQNHWWHHSAAQGRSVAMLPKFMAHIFAPGSSPQVCISYVLWGPRFR